MEWNNWLSMCLAHGILVLNIIGKLVQHYGKQYGGSPQNDRKNKIFFLKKKKSRTPFDPAVQLLGIYLEKTLIRKDTCTPMFTAALFMIAKIWKQPKCPLTDEWIKKLWLEYYSAIKKNEIMPFVATWMGLEIIILSEVSQTKTNIIWYHLYVESKKKWYKGNYLQNRNRLTT